MSNHPNRSKKPEQRVLVHIIDASDPRYDRYVLAPPGMDRENARANVDAAIVGVREANPDEYLFEELEAALTPAGFVFPETISTNETW